MQKIVGQILADVEEGESLSSSMKKYPEAFSKTYIALIKSGEVGGVLDEVLVRLADNLEKQQEFKGKVKGALIYPAIVIAGMFIVALVMLIFVIPQLTSLYDQFDAELPLVTKILIGVSDFMQFFWPFLILLIGGGFYGYNAYRQTENGRRKTDELLFKIPIMGDLQKQIILTDLTRTMSLMVGSGVSILEGLTISSEVVGNRVISDALEDAADLVEKGFPVAFAFSKHPEAFPFILSQMVAVGEETGKMDEVLIKVSHVFEVESEQKVKALTSSVEPIILLFLGVGVAFLVVAIILPIYNLTTSL
jgi:type IV pilus assembly protein PilC